MKTQYIRSVLFLLTAVLCRFFIQNATAQDCTSLHITWSASESRCMSTGSITVTATGGSGAYNYKVTGPATTPFTSSPVITGLPAGMYQVTVKDIETGCQLTKDSVAVNGSYTDPRFQLIKTDVTCAGNDGSLSVDNLQFGLSPFSFTLIAPSPSQVGATNTTGVFTHLIAGEYAVQLMDSCGGIQVRRITIENYHWWVDTLSVHRTHCDSALAVIGLKNNKGATNTSGNSFTHFSYGWVKTAGDTAWYPDKTFTFFLGNRRSVALVAKDPCGTVHSGIWHVPAAAIPKLDEAVTTSNITCTSFTATVSGQENLTHPNYCLYDHQNTLISCNATGIFTAISFGSYCIKTTDACYDTTITRCFTQLKPVPSLNETVTISDRTCTTFRASAGGQLNLTDPQYCLFNQSNQLLGCNATGIFPNLAYGTYTMEITNGCLDTTIRRTFTASLSTPSIGSVSFSSTNCTNFTVTVTGRTNLIDPQFCLYDQHGNTVSCNATGVFTGIGHGSYCVKATTACGVETNTVCFTSALPRPAVNDTVQIADETCTGFSASITGQLHLTNPQYCLYTNANTLVSCNTSGVFANIPYGAYCIRITDGCYDTTIVRCFAQSRPLPSVDAFTVQYNSGCSSMTATVTGTHLTHPQYYLYDSLNNLLQQNTTGIFTHLPFGRYCAAVADGCVDTTIRVCQTFALNKTVSVVAYKTCALDATNLLALCASPFSPYEVKVYHPNGSLVYSTTSNQNVVSINNLPILSGAEKYKVVGTDGCGNKDSAFVLPDAAQITKTISAASKCPSSQWQNGSGDITVTCSSNLYAVTPAVIVKDGNPYPLSYSSNTGNTYTFSDLEPGTYVVQYSMLSCSSSRYDTVTIRPYTFPRQSGSAVYQCNDNSFSLGASATEGIGPYAYEIIGSEPQIPSIVSPPQTNPVFSINNGTTYSLIRLRTTDACGNATLSDVSVLPLQNVSIKASSTCLYQGITLSVDTIPNATYKWYRKTTVNDSILLGSNSTYNIPTLIPEETGTYVCKVSVNNDCLTRLSTFQLTGECVNNNFSLPVEVRLTGKAAGNTNQLSWTVNDEEVTEYSIERASSLNRPYTIIGKLPVQQPSAKNTYLFTDNHPDSRNFYRLRMVHQSGVVEYSNIIQLVNYHNHTIFIHPNPAKNVLHISVGSTNASSYKVELWSISGQLVHAQEMNSSTAKTLTIQRTPTMKPGMYLLKLIHTGQQTGYTYKVIFE